MKIFSDERGYKVTEQELKESYLELKNNKEFTGTFNQYIDECCGKNGTLTKI